MEQVALPGIEIEANHGRTEGAEALGLSNRWSAVFSQPANGEALKAGAVWLVLAGGLVLLLVVLLNLGSSASQSDQVVDHTLPPSQVAEVVAPESLGLTLGDLTERWNEVESPPAITGGLLRSPESGQFDSFRYRFNQGSLVAGAYDQDNEYLYVVMTSSWLVDESSTRMTIHLCHVVEPFSQSCLDAYHQQGLGGQPLESYLETAHEAEWISGGNTWRLAIEDGIQTIRVFAPGAGT